MNDNYVDEDHWFEKTISLLEQNVIGVKVGIYGIALCGLGIALRSVRPFQKFASPKDIPHSFMEKHLKLHGKVLGVDYFPKPLLLIDHQPIFFKSLRKPKGLLVNIEGVNISNNGISWIQTVAVGSPVVFTLLHKQEQYVSCIVSQNKRNVGNHLVSLGFASVAPYNFALEDCKAYSKYYKSLLLEENKAEKLGTGMWGNNQKKGWLTELLLSKIGRLNPNKLLLRLK